MEQDPESSDGDEMIKEDEKRLFAELLKEPKRPQGGLFWRLMLFEKLGINEKRVDYILEKWSGRGIWDSGVTTRTGWFTFQDGFCDPIRADSLKWFLELSGGWLPPGTMLAGMQEALNHHKRLLSTQLVSTYIKIKNPQGDDKEYAQQILEHLLKPDADNFKPRANMKLVYIQENGEMQEVEL